METKYVYVVTHEDYSAENLELEEMVLGRFLNKENAVNLIKKEAENRGMEQFSENYFGWRNDSSEILYLKSFRLDD